MEISIPDISKKVIWDYVDEVKGLEEKKKELTKLYIDPIVEQIEVLKQKIIVEWRAFPSEKKFFGVANSASHATVSQSVKKEMDLEAILKDVLKVGDVKPDTLALAMKMSPDDFESKYVTVKKWNPSVRIY